MQYSLSLQEIELCKKKKGLNNQLAFGIMIIYFKEHIQFPSNEEYIISKQILFQVAASLKINLPLTISFDWDTRTQERYRNEIRMHLGYKIPTIENIDSIIGDLVENLIPRHLSDSILLEQIKVLFRKSKIEIVNTKQLESYILLAKQKFEINFFDQIFKNLSPDHLLLIDSILLTDKERSSGPVSLVLELSELKQDISGAKLKNIKEAIDKINTLNQVILPDSLMESVDRKILYKYYTRIMAFAPSNILDFSIIEKYATMAIFCRIRLELILDSLTDTMIKLFKKMRSNAERSVDYDILREVKRVDGKFDILEKLAILNAINKQKLYYVNPSDKDNYKNIKEVLKTCINWQFIEDNYDEMVKHMVALKLGIVTPSVLIKRFSKDNYNHPVYQALIELGKANKTVFLCQYLASEECRIEINEGLNVVERLNSVMDFIFYGKLGKLTTNNTDDQELSVLCLHLLQVCMVYINTLIIQQILIQPHWHNKFTPTDYRALTPLFSGHINPYGLFPLDFNQRLSLGVAI